MQAGIQLGGIDYVILVVYFLFVLGIGWALKRYTKTSEDFFLSGRSIPAWIAELARKIVGSDAAPTVQTALVLEERLRGPAFAHRRHPRVPQHAAVREARRGRRAGDGA